MNSVGVPRTTPVASPLATSRSMRARTSAPVRSSSKRSRSRPISVAYERRSSSCEGLLTVVQQVVHLPEAILTGRRLGRCGRRERMRVDLGQWEVPEREADPTWQLSLDPLDRPERLPRVGALVVAVLEDDRRVRGATHVIDVRVEGLDLIRGLHLGLALVLG